jgi:hypothetical protein
VDDGRDTTVCLAMEGRNHWRSGKGETWEQHNTFKERIPRGFTGEKL